MTLARLERNSSILCVGYNDSTPVTMHRRLGGSNEDAFGSASEIILGACKCLMWPVYALELVKVQVTRNGTGRLGVLS